ncbi:NACHT, LRR and PYD domains-containing protein 1-like isoform X18 [Cygnus atratus]|uniref:NACHT, LRR and PYD domains-containing protein 1-like isoform X14 n=1 Tax=Cygnus atratus TaxID=8868 RepID=UPI0021B7A169|nr:NACHT, LRR and PYD domains-containing protein 1-like isoform X14 [Cygnus atratus]XP_050572734.1 NACHT, LRR and PYD domains-containing protein 1-like isoform X15 [Cygnus atratus]XP_050572735.1 NACHT, LRR and PYD domains-containing protein 1-like isoform X16 [Cygnus atratus]XP_050572736.1 NACHT, LRR and PYD domains-containing protein 1-like isoform X17 [Cygnus atratus]XP_050572737.1 NACHT, LRR and PYD domains-containing protein 1-like isoform X18 [Cygnus atratus]
MEKIMADLLRKTLDDLGRYAFPRFKRELSKIQPKEQYERIELESLMGLSRAALAELLCSHYGQPYCVEVTVRVLRAMGRSTLAYTLLHRLTYGASFVERYREIVIQKASNVANIIMALLRERVLTSEQSDSIMSEGTNQKRMKKLYELVPTWDVTNKYCLYKVLCATNPILTLVYTAVQAQGSIISEGPQKHMAEFQDPWEDIFYLQGPQKHTIEFQGLQAQSASRRAGGLQDQSGPKPQGATAGDMPSKKTDWSDEGSSVHGAAASMLPQYTLFGDIDKSTSPSSGRNTRSGAICTSCPTEEDWAEEVKPEIIGDKRGKKEIYRAHFPRAGLFRCVETDLEFLVRTATSIEYKYSFWERHLASGIPPVWMEVGPVFDIHAPPGTVEAIHIPHFLCLGEGKQNTSWMQIAHIVDGNLLLEKPTRVKSFHAVLEDPSFSPMGVIFLSDKLPFIPVHSLVLLYRVFSAADITFHLYLIPNHRGLEKAVDEDEKRSGHSLLVNKPPNTIRPLKFNRWYRVSGPSRAEINPKELKFVYLALDRRQLFTEIYTKDMEEGMQLTLTKVVQEGKRDCRLLWGTLLRAGDIKQPATSSTPTCSGHSFLEHEPSSALQVRHKGHFVEKHREQLIQRVTSVNSILDRLLKYSVLTDEQYERIRSNSIRQEKMRLLYSFMPSWDTKCKNLFLNVLKETNHYLIQELQGL